MTSAPRTRLDPELRRHQILLTATRIFREQPFSEVSLDAIAAEAGVTRGLLHHYFGSKRKLYLEVLRKTVTIPPEIDIVPPGTTGDLREVLDACVGLWLQMIIAAGGLWPGATMGFAESDIDEVMAVARNNLVERMVDELPWPKGIERDSLEAALHSYAAFAAVASDSWLRERNLTEGQLRAMLRETLVAIAHSVVPAMDAERNRF